MSKEKPTAESILQKIQTESMSRQDIYKALNQVGKNALLDSEMKRLGFWDPDKISSAEHNVTQLEEEKAQLEKSLVQLTSTLSGKEDAEQRLREETAERIEQNRKKLNAQRRKREKQRLARIAAWEEKQKKDIVFLGESVSRSLHSTYESKKKQAFNQLPPISTAEDLAQLLETDIPTLRLFGFFRPVSTFNHYHRFSIPKKTGGERIISAPLPRLKALQKQIQEKILSLVPLHDAAHGFVPARSIHSNALPHVQKKVVINMDLQNFFPSISFSRVQGCFVSLGYSPKIATILALLCTEAPSVEAKLDSKTWYIAQGERFLPQGAPTSPVITNILCRNLDYRLSGLVKKHNITYTRYADDLSFGCDDTTLSIGKFVHTVRKIVEQEGFVVHPQKTKIMRDGNRKEVTGIVINEKTSISRRKLRNFSALLHHIDKDGPKGKTWGESDDVLTAALGFASFVRMVDPQKGEKFHARVIALCARYR